MLKFSDYIPEDHRNNPPEDAREVATTCAHCHDDIREGAAAWRFVGDEAELTACSIACLTYLTAKYEADIDEFSYEVEGE